MRPHGDGGAWLEVDGQRVDLIYRDLAAVEHWTSEAEAGRFEVQREVGYVAGVATYVLAGELAVNEVLTAELPRPSFPDPLRETAPALWSRLAGGALHYARVHLGRGDVVASTANLGQAVLCVAQARVAAAGEWALNEKGIVDRAGLGAAASALTDLDPATAVDHIADLLAVEWV